MKRSLKPRLKLYQCIIMFQIEKLEQYKRINLRIDHATKS